MTARECINRINLLKPHQYDTSTLMGWLSNVEGKMYEEAVSWHKDALPPLLPYTELDMDVVLMVPDQYADVYLYYLQAQIDYWNNETARFNNSMMMFNVAYSDFANWYNRAHESTNPYLRTTLSDMRL